MIDTCVSVQSAFFEFRKTLEKGSDTSGDSLWWTTSLDIGEFRVSFECLNVAWVSKQREAPGTLFFPFNQYESQENDSADIRCVVLHHPPHWFHQTVYRDFRRFLRNLGDVIISGHEHVGASGSAVDTETGKSNFIEGFVLQDSDRESQSAFNVVELNPIAKTLESTEHNWNGQLYEPALKPFELDVSGADGGASSGHLLTEDFRRRLDDPGAPFAHPGRAELILGDIYVFPDLKESEGDDGRSASIVRSSKFCDRSQIEQGILVEGEEKVGRTSFLFQLYRAYHDQGMAPVYLEGEHLRGSMDSDIAKVIRRAVKAQYGDGWVAEYEQLPTSRRPILVDEFDKSRLRSGTSRAAALRALRNRCGGFVATVGEMFELREVLEGDAEAELGDVTHYHLLPFGYARRHDLVERWYSLDRDDASDGEYLAKCDQAERIMNAIMAKGLIPSLPLYLLTLLQGLEAGQAGEFKDSELGHYYQVLLTLAFRSAGIKSNRLTEHYSYVEALAYEFHRVDTTELSEGQLREFNAKYSKQWHTVDYSSRVDVLTRARILRPSDGGYRFRYPYIYYYLKGKYLSDRLDEIHIKEYVQRCCRHLYVRDHANTVLFLAHHTNDEFLLDCILESVRGLFCTVRPVTFDDDTGGLARVIENAPAVSYVGGNPVDHRRRRSELRDELDDGRDGLVDEEETGDEISLLSQIIMLFKATEILGQVLKTQYSRISRSRKSVLLDELFQGPLRALRDFYNYLESFPGALAGEIESALAKRGDVADADERQRIARRTASWLVQLVTFSFVMRAAGAASTESLREDIDGVVAKSGSRAFRLIGMGIRLDSPDDIPRSEIEALHKEVKGEILAASTLRLMVIDRLYMFKTKEVDMQWLSDKLGINLKRQHRIAYQRARPMLGQ